MPFSVHTSTGVESAAQDGSGVAEEVRRPDYVGAHANWGAALPQLGEPARAIDHFEQVLRIEPDLAQARANLALALTRQGKPTEATEHFQHARKGQKAE